MFCQKCGNQIPDGAKFCNRCGAAQSKAPGRGPQPSQQGGGFAQRSQPVPPGNRYVEDPKRPAKKKMPKALKVLLGIFGVIAAGVLIVCIAYWNDFYRKPEKAWKEAQELYASGEYYEAYRAFGSAPESRAEYRKPYDDAERSLASLLKYCSTLKEGDAFQDCYGREWRVVRKTEDSYKIFLGLNRPTYETEESTEISPKYYDFHHWSYWEEAILPVDNKPVFAMADELSMDTFGKIASEEAKELYAEEYAANPDVQWFYPMVMLDLSFPKEDPFWQSVMYGARLNTDTGEFLYGPLKFSIPSETDIPQVWYTHLGEAYAERTEAEVISEFEENGVSDVAVNYFETRQMDDGYTMVETMLVDYYLSDGSVQATCEFRCWDIRDPRSFLQIWWVVDDLEDYEKVAGIMDTLQLAEKPATENEGYFYLGYRSHVRGGTTGEDNPISHTHDRQKSMGTRY